MDQSGLRDLLLVLDEKGASDLHLKPGSPPKMRLKGSLEALVGEPSLTRGDVDKLVLELFGPLDTAFVVDNQAATTYVADGVGRFRVRAYRQRGSIAVVVRRIPDRVGSLAELGLPQQVATLAESARGLVLVAGSHHSGRRTTLASMLDHVNRTRAAHIVSIEQPLEILHRDAMGSVSQLEVGVDTPTFCAGINAAVAADGDVIIVSDLDDGTAASAALDAAEDGLLVLAGIRAPHGVEALRRFVDFFPHGHHDSVRLALAGVLVGVTAQRLAPKASGIGRVPAVEITLATPRVLECLLDPDTVGVIAQVAEDCHELGMQGFAAAIADLLEQGVIDLRGALTVADDWGQLHREMQTRGLLGN